MPTFLAVASGEHMKILAAVLAIVTLVVVAFDNGAVTAPRTTMLAGSVVFGQFYFCQTPSLNTFILSSNGFAQRRCSNKNLKNQFVLIQCFLWQ